MGAIIYTATDELEAGTTSGQSKQIETEFQRIDPDLREVGDEVRSLSGVSEYELDRYDETIVLKSGIVVSSELPRWREFFASVGDRAIFQVDPDGTIATPVDVRNCKLESGRYRPIWEGPGQYTLEFTVRII